VQAAKLLNAGRDERSLKEVTALGADTVIHTDHVDETGPYDVIVDYIAGPPAEAALRAGAPGVRLVQIGERAGDRIDIPAALLRAKGATVYGFMMTHAGQSAVTAAYHDMAQHAAAGRLKVDVEEHSLSEVADLWERASRKKLVLRP
jgi:NADPH2:quinone reductase